MKISETSETKEKLSADTREGKGNIEIRKISW